MIKVLLVDDHSIIRDGIKAMLYGDDKIHFVGECSDGSEVVDFLSKNDVDIVLMDINMPKMNGIDATKLVMDKFPGSKIIALTMHNEEGYITKILKAGAVGYVLKNTGKDELIEAIEQVYEGGTYFGSEVAEIMMARYLKNGSKPKSSSSLVNVDDLTKREIEILKLITEEFTNIEIGEKLFISPRTVDTHRRNLLQKLGVKNTAGLVKFAIQNGIAD